MREAYSAGSMLRFSTRRSVPSILQAEVSECGLAAIAMIAAYHGVRLPLSALRKLYPTSLMGTTLKSLVSISNDLGFAARAVRLELCELGQLSLPCILHWNMNHYVVLVQATERKITIHDPALGTVHYKTEQVSEMFTGVALELRPTSRLVTASRQEGSAVLSSVASVPGLKKMAIQILGLSVGLQTIALISPFFMQFVVDGAVVSADHDLLTVLAIAFALLFGVQSLMTFARSWCVLYMSTHLSLQWEGSAFAHLLRLPIPWFERRHVGDVLARFNSLSTIQRVLTTTTLEAVVDGLLALATVGLMFLYSRTLTFIVIGGVSTYALLRFLSKNRLRQLTEEQVALSAKASSLLLESIRAIGPIRLYDSTGSRLSKWLNAKVDSFNGNLKVERLGISLRTAQTAISGIEMVVILYLGATSVIDGSLSVGMLFAFVAYRAHFSSRATALVDKLVEFATLRVHLTRFEDIALTVAEDDSSTGKVPCPTNPDLVLEDVSFSYGQGLPDVLRRVSLRIPFGESVALTGPSGSGKSTLLKILAGLLEPTSGRVLIGGIPLGMINKASYRSKLSTLMQDDSLLAGSIAENICFFDAEIGQAAIEGAAKLAMIDSEIASMPMGYNTTVGDTGSVLSGGQRQRVMLARTLLRDSQILLLDEPTSHLDIAKEIAVAKTIGNVRATRVSVAHREAYLSSVDRLVILDRGSIFKDQRKATVDG